LEQREIGLTVVVRLSAATAAAETRRGDALDRRMRTGERIAEGTKVLHATVLVEGLQIFCERLIELPGVRVPRVAMRECVTGEFVAALEQRREIGRREDTTGRRVGTHEAERGV